MSPRNDAFFSQWDLGDVTPEEDMQYFMNPQSTPVPQVSYASNSMVRPEDTADYEFGIPAGYRNNLVLLKKTQEESDNKAMKYLQEALKSSAEVTPTQGIAAALLAAIPTFGGYLIGKNVGSPDLPEGYFEAGGTRAAIGLDKLQTGGAYGGLAGAQVGLGSADSYLKGLEADQAQANKIYNQMASIEANRATRSEARADALLAAGLRETQLDERQQNYLQAQRELAGQRNQARVGPVPEQEKSFWAKTFDVPESFINTYDDVARLQRRQENVDITNRQQKKWEREDLKTNIPILEKIPGMVQDERDQGKAQAILDSYGQVQLVYLPELKRVFTEDATIAEQRAAIANMIIAIKTQEEMGANFTAMEKELVDAGLPRIAGLSVGELTSKLKDTLEGGNALAKIQRLEDISKKAMELKLRNYGYRVRRFGVDNSSNKIPIQERIKQIQGVN
ncbi:MAG: hypothetical protein BWY21_00349 [Parcubacteria group bacterium ADurb.Bin216]|nr:MAG: hypothetical protein BWY21_00349 [Parcubacteria group bacterium ADurb.Bin216]